MIFKMLSWVGAWVGKLMASLMVFQGGFLGCKYREADMVQEWKWSLLTDFEVEKYRRSV